MAAGGNLPAVFMGQGMRTISREWEGQTAFIIAGGPSVAEQDIEPLRERNTIVINSSCFLAPWADFLFFGDARWWRHYGASVAFSGRIITTSHCKDPRFIKLKKVFPDSGLAEDPAELAIGRTSTHAGINLAAHLGVSRIALLGVDMQKDGDRCHHHEPHPWPPRDRCWDEQMAHLKMTAPALERLGIEVINTTMRSRIDWWPKMPLEAVLKLPETCNADV